MLTAIVLISILYALYLLVRYWEKLAKKEAKDDGYPKAGKGKVISQDDAEKIKRIAADELKYGNSAWE